MTTPRLASRYLLLGAATVALTACGGGGGSDPAPVVVTPPPPPVATTSDTFVTVQGEIDGFGSIIVNGTRYDTDTAKVVKDGRDVNLSALSVGQIVALRARRNGEGELPTALRVRYEEVLEGPVDAIADDRASLVILGQTVFLTRKTIFEDDLARADIVVGDVLEVSGSFTADGDIVASYVEISDDTDGDYEVHGTVGALDTDALTFRVKGLKIGYANAELADFDDGETLSNGDRVEVEGSTFLNDGTLLATRVEFEGDDLEDEFEDGDDDDAEEAEIEGFITAFTDATAFEVAGIPVITTSDTEFEGCAPGDLALDVEVEVEGTYDADGVLVAEEVECEFDPEIRYEARVDAVDTDAGTITVLGVEVAVDMSTQFQDKSEARIREFGLDDIDVGDPVQIRAFETADGLLAQRVRRLRERKFDETEVRGFVDAIGVDSVIVSGVEVFLDLETECEFEDRDLACADFLASIAVGDLIALEANVRDDGTLLATEVEYGDDDDFDDDDEDDDDDD